MKTTIFLIKTILLIALVLIITSCSNQRSKNHFFAKGKVCNNLTKEVYIVGSWGALSADTYADYLTDSINFRVFVGTHGDDEDFGYTCKRDTVFVIRYSVADFDNTKIIDTEKVYFLNDLKKYKPKE